MRCADSRRLVEITERITILEFTSNFDAYYTRIHPEDIGFRDSYSPFLLLGILQRAPLLFIATYAPIVKLCYYRLFPRNQ